MEFSDHDPDPGAFFVLGIHQREAAVFLFVCIQDFDHFLDLALLIGIIDILFEIQRLPEQFRCHGSQRHRHIEIFSALAIYRYFHLIQ